MTDAGFVIAAYGVVFVALALYVASIWRRSSQARAASLRIRRDAEGAGLHALSGETGGPDDEATQRA